MTTAMSSKSRLAAALAAYERQADPDYVDEAMAEGVLAADPTLAADLALGAAVRESGLVDAAKALDRFMRQPDENEDGTPADWAPGLDAIGDFQNAVAIIKAAKEASE